MDLSKSNSNRIYFADKDYLRKTTEQIQRDFNMSGVNFEDPISLPETYNELFTLVLENIAVLVRTSDNQLKNLLYRIDISELSIQKRVANSIDIEIENVISSMLIERCLLKVLTREKFS